jgi:hypothetical protein
MEFDPDALLRVFTLVTEVHADEVLTEDAVLGRLSRMGALQKSEHNLLYALVSFLWNMVVLGCLPRMGARQTPEQNI